MKVLSHLLIFFIAVSCLGTAFAQTNVNEEQGLKPYDSWHGCDLDSVSLTNGGLTLHIPLLSYPQRGNLDLSFLLRYSTKHWQVKTTCTKGTKPVCTFYWGIPRGDPGTSVVSSVDWWGTSSGSTSGGDPTTGAGATTDWQQAVISPDGNTHQLGGGANVPEQYGGGPI